HADVRRSKFQRGVLDAEVLRGTGLINKVPGRIEPRAFDRYVIHDLLAGRAVGQQIQRQHFSRADRADCRASPIGSGKLTPIGRVFAQDLPDGIRGELAEGHAIRVGFSEDFDRYVVAEINALTAVRYETVNRAFASDRSATHVSDLRDCGIQKRVVKELILAAAGTSTHDPSRLRESRRAQNQKPN